MKKVIACFLVSVVTSQAAHAYAPNPCAQALFRQGVGPWAWCSYNAACGADGLSVSGYWASASIGAVFDFKAFAVDLCAGTDDSCVVSWSIGPFSGGFLC